MADTPIQEFDASAGPRERLIATAIDLVRRRGVFATSVADLLGHSGAARNSIYQHFPKGKSGLIATATGESGEQMTAFIGHLTTTRSVHEAVDALVKWWKRELEDSDYALGCPVAAAAMAAPDEPEVAATANVAFDAWRRLVADAALRGGLSTDDAKSFALFVVNAIEGAIIQCRSQRSVESLDVAAAQLKVLYGALRQH
ncbi:TetR/AcrR family transcriptional regulator [Williamsia sp. 1138]|uniref:TetR/AcrR family transcriptional regulator n=1 Tax=Williamsia sp. 1138 TaxID=1903117 RepID=UPI00143DAF76|nr:TetR/AcrR family transcriptional regulator [Williamsia sp. 1138]